MILTLEKKLKSFLKQYKRFNYKPNEIIYYPGDHFSRTCFIESGYLRIYMIGENGKEITIDIVGPNIDLSFTFGLLDNKSNYYYQALTSVEVWCAPKKDFIQFIKNDKNLYFEMARDMLLTIKVFLQVNSYLISGNASIKVAVVLLMLAQKFGKTISRNNLLIEFNVPHWLIASFCGLARETVSIQMKKIERKGFIMQTKQGLIIKNIEKFKREIIKDF